MPENIGRQDVYGTGAVTADPANSGQPGPAPSAQIGYDPLMGSAGELGPVPLQTACRKALVAVDQGMPRHEPMYIQYITASDWYYYVCVSFIPTGGHSDAGGAVVAIDKNTPDGGIEVLSPGEIVAHDDDYPGISVDVPTEFVNVIIRPSVSAIAAQGQSSNAVTGVIPQGTRATQIYEYIKRHQPSFDDRKCRQYARWVSKYADIENAFVQWTQTGGYADASVLSVNGWSAARLHESLPKASPYTVFYLLASMRDDRDATMALLRKYGIQA